MTKIDIHKKAMICALKQSLGVVSTACKMIDTSRQSHYTWLLKDAAYKLEVEAVQDEALDYVESKLFELISGVELPETKVFCNNGVIVTQELTKKFAPDTAATIFYLKTRGKKRGYVERLEVETKEIKIGKALEEEEYV